MAHFSQQVCIDPFHLPESLSQFLIGVETQSFEAILETRLDRVTIYVGILHFFDLLLQLIKFGLRLGQCLINLLHVALVVVIIPHLKFVKLLL